MSRTARRLYRLLLRLLPRSFRSRHAAEIEETLDTQAAARGSGGTLSGARFWTGAMLDLVRGAVAERGSDLRRDAWQDLRYAARTLRHAPVFTLLGVTALALGIGANTAIFTLINEIALRPLPVREPERLVNILVDQPGGNSFLGFSYPEYRDYRDRNGVLDGVAVTSGVTVSVGQAGSEGFAQLVSADYFDVLGIGPTRGRLFTDQEVRGGATVAVASHGFWQRRAGGSGELIGSTLLVDGIPFTVVGVLPEGFGGIFIGFPADLFLPVTMMERMRPGAELMSRREQSLEMFGRLRAGVSVGEADRALDALAADLEEDFPGVGTDRRVEVHPLTGIDHSLRSGASSFVGILVVLSALVLLIACLDVGGLLLARGERRHREIAIRTAIGASRGRVVRQLVTETSMLFVLGAAAAVLLASQINAFLSRFIESLPVPLGFELRIDWRVLALTGVVTLATAVATGLIPALRTSQARPGTGASRRRTTGSHRVRSGFLVAQVGISMALLVTAGLFLGAVRAGQEMDPGFELDGLATARFGLPVDEYSAAEAYELYDRLARALREAAPGASVSVASSPPIGVAHTPTPVSIPGHEPPPGQAGVAVDVQAVGFDYFRTLGVPVLEGRVFERRETRSWRGSGGRRVALINRTMAQRFWPERSPVGRVLRLEDGDPVEVIGVVDDTRHVIQEASAAPLMYLPAAQRPSRRMTLLVRSSNPLGSLNEALGTVVSRLDPALPPTTLESVAETISFFLLPQRAAAQLIGGMGLLALLLAVAGVYGIVSYTVGCRRRELGVRIALGGEPRGQVALVMRGALVLTLSGIILGGAGAAAVVPLLRSLLFGLPVADVSVVALTAGALLLTALVAAWIPARRVLELDAVEILRRD